jgi:hypothetical protein
MSAYFCPSRQGFIHDEVITDIPEDAIPVSEKDYVYFLGEITKGKLIELVDGKIVAREQEPNVSWDDIRKKRNTLLSACDWSQVADVPLTSAQKTAWNTYRQKLRDITDSAKQNGDALSVVWPTAPNA